MAEDHAAAARRLELIVGLVLLFVVLEHVVGPWLWIAARGTATSAWGAGGAPGPARQPSETFSRELLGGRGKSFGILALLFGGVLLHILRGSRESFLDVLVGYTMCWLPSAILLVWAWGRIGKLNAVHPGLMADFFLSGGLLGVAYAIVFEELEGIAWQLISPHCTSLHFDVRYVNGLPSLSPMTETCGMYVAGMWILTPGLIEETAKALWLFLRLRKSPDDLPETCCGCVPAHTSTSWRQPRTYCGFWYKLAPTPYHVLLCSLSAGAGFECMENMKYAFSQSDKLPRESSVNTAFVRALTSNLHMMWTGLIGLGLAQRMFPSGGHRTPRPTEEGEVEDNDGGDDDKGKPGRSLLCVVMPSVVLHGLWDFSITLFMNVISRYKAHMIGVGETGRLIVLVLALALGASVGGWLALGMLTSTCRRRSCSCCRRSCSCRFRSCCFAPDFFGPAPRPAEAARQPLLPPP